MTDNFDKALTFTLQWEGGYVSAEEAAKRGDPGGETNFGISKRAYPNEDIANMTRERAAELYRRDYWEAAGCNNLPFPMDLIVFDTAVNMGVGAATRLFKTSADWQDYLLKRLARYIEIGGPSLKGWKNRVVALNQTIRRATA